jgi:hypothetical protein
MLKAALISAHPLKDSGITVNKISKVNLFILFILVAGAGLLRRMVAGAGFEPATFRL